MELKYDFAGFIHDRKTELHLYRQAIQCWELHALELHHAAMHAMFKCHYL